MPKPSTTVFKRPTILIIALLCVTAIGLIAYQGRSKSPDEVGQLISQSTIPYPPVRPRHLPTSAQFQSSASQFDADSHVLTLHWVFPAQTLPGQGTLIIYQHAKPDTVQPDLLPVVQEKRLQVNTGFGQIEGVLGVLQRPDDVPQQPGQRALKLFNDQRQILLVSYAISDDELIRIAESLR